MVGLLSRSTSNRALLQDANGEKDDAAATAQTAQLQVSLEASPGRCLGEQHPLNCKPTRTLNPTDLQVQVGQLLDVGADDLVGVQEDDL